MTVDCAIVGTGPAGLSAALTLQQRGKSLSWIGNPDLSGKVSRAERITNYPGFLEGSGERLAELFREQARAAGLEVVDQMVNEIMPFDGQFVVMAGSECFDARTVILATGTAPAAQVPGEAALLGRGVSYCATCDVVLCRGKTVAVHCGAARFEDEARFLAERADKLYFFPTYRESAFAAANVKAPGGRIAAVLGEGRVSGVRLSTGEEVPVDMVFFLREAVALAHLLPGVETDGAHIVVDRAQATSTPGVFAAGDCTGRPYQYAKAVGEGNVAAHSALDYLKDPQK